MSTQEKQLSGKGKRIVVTGGSGKAGKYVIQEFLDRGYKVLNLDLAPLEIEGVSTLKTGRTTFNFLLLPYLRTFADLTDSGQVFNALTSNYDFAAYSDTSNPRPPDAVVHLAGMFSFNAVYFF